MDTCIMCGNPSEIGEIFQATAEEQRLLPNLEEPFFCCTVCQGVLSDPEEGARAISQKFTRSLLGLGVPTKEAEELGKKLKSFLMRGFS